jgi:single-stranded-DNA-specific exonuclease
MREFHSKIAGVSFNERQKNIPNVVPGQNLWIKHEKNNPHDQNAVLVFADEKHEFELGHLNKKMAKKVVERLNNGVKQTFEATKVTGEPYPKRYGLNIKLVFDDGETKN